MSDIIKIDGQMVSLDVDSLKDASIETIIKILNYTEDTFKPLLDYMSNNGIPYYMILYGRFNNESLYKQMGINILKTLGAVAMLFPPVRLVGSGSRVITVVPKLVFSKGGLVNVTLISAGAALKTEENNELYTLETMLKNAIIFVFEDVIVSTFKMAKDGIMKLSLSIAEKIKKDGSVLVNGLPIYLYTDLDNMDPTLLSKNSETYDKLRPDLLIIFEYITTQAKTNKFVDNYYFESLSLMKEKDPKLYSMVKNSIFGKQHVRQGFIRLVHNAMYYFSNSYEVTYDDFNDNIDDVLPSNILSDFKKMILDNSLEPLKDKKGKQKTSLFGDKLYKVVYDKSASQSYNIGDVQDLNRLTKAQFFNVNKKLQNQTVLSQFDIEPQKTEKNTANVSTPSTIVGRVNSVLQKHVGRAKLTSEGVAHVKKYGITTTKSSLTLEGFDPSKYYFSYSGSEPFNTSIGKLDSNLLYNLNLMAYDYFNTYKKQFIVTSGYRSMESQQKLYNNFINGKGSPANRPGYSLHEYGMAVDINSADAIKLDSSGMLSKYDFWRPIPNKEPWHVQPKNITDKNGDGMLEADIVETKKKQANTLQKTKPINTTTSINTNIKKQLSTNTVVSTSGKYYSINIGRSMYVSNIKQEKPIKANTRDVKPTTNKAITDTKTIEPTANKEVITDIKTKPINHSNISRKYAPEDTIEINKEVKRLGDEFAPKNNKGASIPGDIGYKDTGKGASIPGDIEYKDTGKGASIPGDIGYEEKKIATSYDVKTQKAKNITYKKGKDDNTYYTSDGNFITKKTRTYDDGTKEDYYLTNTGLELTENMLQNDTDEQFTEMSGLSKDQFQKGINLINNKQSSTNGDSDKPSVDAVKSVEITKKLGL
ncbi:putative peptidase [Campylobacter phage PC5]|uniref:Putative peptidase n=1 Tax=Campylobacter phage PC5 TaxID=1541690 RepID=A0A1B0XVY0_9CAUD|nr:putative peptidase [Campylobacter phage PC5]